MGLINLLLSFFMDSSPQMQNKGKSLFVCCDLNFWVIWRDKNIEDGIFGVGKMTFENGINYTKSP